MSDITDIVDSKKILPFGYTHASHAYWYMHFNKIILVCPGDYGPATQANEQESQEQEDGERSKHLGAVITNLL